jgi:DNA polymerase I-like protein with 3'-5' exonuclease and polymerase domains
LEGDVHSVTQQALLEYVGEGKVGRDRAKTWMYAFLYGAGDEKLGKILAPGKTPEQQKKIGAYSRSLFLKKLAALKYLLDDVKKKHNKNGYLISLDGRRVYTRSEHSALNSLIQTAGSLICRRWMVVYNRALVELFDSPPGGGWLYPWAALGWFHDENQLAVWDDPLVIDATKIVLVDSIRSMTEHFHFRCPLDGEAKVGANWCQTH